MYVNVENWLLWVSPTLSRQNAAVFIGVWQGDYCPQTMHGQVWLSPTR
jgi:hypothetical protein